MVGEFSGRDGEGIRRDEGLNMDRRLNEERNGTLGENALGPRRH